MLFKEKDEIQTLKNANYLNSILNILPEQIYWMDTEGRIIDCNQHQARVFGFKTKEELIGKNIYDVAKILGWQRAIADKIYWNNKQVIENNEPLIEEEMIKVDDEERFFLAHKNPFLDKKGNVIGIVGVSIDITDRKRAEEYRIKNEMAEKVNKFLNLVAGSIAHELKNPLAGIRVQMQCLQGIDFMQMPMHDLENTLKKLAKSIINTVDNTSYVIDGMLKKIRTFATGEVHQGDLEELSIEDNIHYFLETYPFKNDERDLVTVVCSNKFSYRGDRLLTTHVLSNLMKNALHAVAETSKPDASITIEIRIFNNTPQLIFRDTATGIPQHCLNKIFDQFETSKMAKGGTGLGLAFCKAVMEDSYGGSITCHSEEGDFTEFTLSFPKKSEVEPKLRLVDSYYNVA